MITAGQGTNSITFKAGPQVSCATFTLTVTDECGCRTTCEREVCCLPPQDEFCTLTQGFYGNQGGKFGNPLQTAAQIMESLLASGGPLVVGKPGQSFTVNPGDSGCIIKKLPANSTPAPLPPGDGVFGPGCTTTTGIPTGAGGRWQSVLLGQTITLAFNIRYNASLTPAHDLANLTVCSTIVTQGSLPGPDGKPGSGDEVIDPASPQVAFTIPNSVMCALLSFPDGDGTQTVRNLLTLANCALGGGNTAGATVADINMAVDAINRGFDRCRFLISCTGGCVLASLFSPNSDQVVAHAHSPVEFVPFASSMNLFRSDSARSLFRWAVVLADVESNPAYFRFGL
jgi:hypothetical protein